MSSLPSKLAKALGSNYPGDPAAAPKPSRHGPASDVALSYMFQQVRALKLHDPGVRVDAPDAVHQLRVAARRLRSALATFRKLTDTTSAKVLRAELQWLAGAVGQARDTEVIRARLKDMINAEPPELLLGPVAQEIEEHLGTVQQQGRAAGLAALDSDRYFRLLDSLDAFLAAPPLSAKASKDALRTVGRLVSAERKRLKAAVRAVDSATGRGPQDVALHEVRKSAKRLRYAAEAASPIFGQQATALARAAEGIQEILGDFQDSVVTRETLLTLAAQTAAEGGNGFSYGRLHALEAAARQRGPPAVLRCVATVQAETPELEVVGDTSALRRREPYDRTPHRNCGHMVGRTRPRQHPFRSGPHGGRPRVGDHLGTDPRPARHHPGPDCRHPGRRDLPAGPLAHRALVAAQPSPSLPPSWPSSPSSAASSPAS